MSLLHQIESRAAWRRLRPAAAQCSAEDALLLLGGAVAVATEVQAAGWTGRVYGLQADLDTSGLPPDRGEGVTWLEDLEWLDLIHRHARIVRW